MNESYPRALKIIDKTINLELHFLSTGLILTAAAFATVDWESVD